MNKIILFCVSFFAMNAAWAQQASTAAPSGSTETVNADNVPIEEYVPKVIIAGKWGAGPGEFGVAWTYASDINAPQEESGDIPPIYPASLAVNSKGDIYILDTVNNRIQKFNPNGEYLKSIEVDSYNGKEQPIWYGKIKTSGGIYVLDRVLNKASQGSVVGVDKWFPFYWPLTAEGINVVVDSKDTLYYYLKRIKDGKETGEVWEFKDDKLVRKTPGDIPESIVKRSVRKEIAVKNRDKKEIALGDLQGKTLILKARKGEDFFDDVSAKKRRISNKVRMGKDGLLGVVCEEGGELWTNYYTEGGKLVKRFRWGSLPATTTDMSDDNGSMYLPETTGNGFKVTKYELVILK